MNMFISTEKITIETTMNHSSIGIRAAVSFSVADKHISNATYSQKIFSSIDICEFVAFLFLKKKFISKMHQILN